MPAIVELSELEAHQIAEAALKVDLAGEGFEHAEVRSENDHGGEPAIFVTAIIQEGREILPPDVVSRAHARLLDALHAAGDRRFPYLRFKWIGEEPVDDAPEAKPA